MISFAPARFRDIVHDIAPLWEDHWVEIGQDRERVPLAPDWEKYQRLDDAGCLVITTARRGAALVGYTFSVVDTHLHYRTTPFAAQDLRYLRPDCRGGRTALRMAIEHEGALRRAGARKALGNVKVAANRDGRLFEHLGYQPVEIVYAKVL